MDSVPPSDCKFEWVWFIDGTPISQSLSFYPPTQPIELPEISEPPYGEDINPPDGLLDIYNPPDCSSPVQSFNLRLA